jgi:hypothetical protein
MLQRPCSAIRYACSAHNQLQKRSTLHTLLLLVLLQEYQGRLRYLLSALETGLEQDAEMVGGHHPFGCDLRLRGFQPNGAALCDMLWGEWPIQLCSF